MMEETYLVEHVKEAVCFVSTDLKADLAASRAGKHKLEYVLPDGINEQLGHIREPLSKAEARERANKEQVWAQTNIGLLQISLAPSRCASLLRTPKHNSMQREFTCIE
jgi:hypothetical protein